MAKQPISKTELKQMEQEARHHEQREEYLEALDIYENLELHGWAQAKHLTAMGYCYLKLRQRQNARTTWLKALERDPNEQSCLDALNRYFPKWEQHYHPSESPDIAGRPSSQVSQNQPPGIHDIHRQKTQLSMEVHLPGQQRQEPATPPDPSPQRTSDRGDMHLPHRAEETGRTAGGAADRLSLQSTNQSDKPASPETRQQPDTQDIHLTTRDKNFQILNEWAESKVNWGYVLEDAQDISHRGAPGGAQSKTP